MEPTTPDTSPSPPRSSLPWALVQSNRPPGVTSQGTLIGWQGPGGGRQPLLTAPQAVCAAWTSRHSELLMVALGRKESV